MCWFLSTGAVQTPSFESRVEALGKTMGSIDEVCVCVFVFLLLFLFFFGLCVSIRVCWERVPLV